MFLRKAPLHALLLQSVNLDDMECGNAPKMHARAPQFFTYFLRGSINRNPQMPPLRQQGNRFLALNAATSSPANACLHKEANTSRNTMQYVDIDRVRAPSPDNFGVQVTLQQQRARNVKQRDFHILQARWRLGLAELAGRIAQWESSSMACPGQICTSSHLYQARSYVHSKSCGDV